MISTKSTNDSLLTLNNLLNDRNKRVFFTRFGDGDLNLMNGINAKNHSPSPALAKELKEAFTINDPRYLIGAAVNYPKEKGMIPGVFAPHKSNNRLAKYLETFDRPQDYTYESALLFHYVGLFRQQLFIDFLSLEVRGKKILFVGNTPKQVAEKIYGHIEYYVNIPFRNAYATIDEWWPKVERFASKAEVILPSAGSASKVINKRLWMSGQQINSFDIGSIIDAIDTKTASRTWIKYVGCRVNNLLLPEHKQHSFNHKKHSIISNIKYNLRSAFFHARGF